MLAIEAYEKPPLSDDAEAEQLLLELNDVLASYDLSAEDRSLPRPVRSQLESGQEAEKHYPEGQKPPLQTAFNHYLTRMFKWDVELTVDTMAKLGSKEIVDWAAYSLLMLTKKMRPNGFVSNMQYHDHNEGVHFLARMERRTFNTNEGSEYTQPNFLPMATMSVFEGYIRVGDYDMAWRFLKAMQPRGKRHVNYFKDHRFSSSDNPLVFNNHKHEHGRDSSGASKKKLPRFGDKTPLIWDQLDVAQDIILTAIQSIRLKRAHWDLDKAKQIYGRRDVMFNAILSENAYIMRDISNLLAEHYPEEAEKYKEDAIDFEEYASSLEQAIQDHMWFKDDVWSPKGNRTHKGVFRSLKGNGKPEKNIDSGDLMALNSDKLKAEQLVSMVNLVLTSFNDEGGLPTAPTDVSYYDPRNKRKTGCNWSGSGWPHMDKRIGGYLRAQAERITTDPEFRAQFASEMEADQTLYLCNIAADILAGINKERTRGVKGVYAEQYDTKTGEPQRYPKVRNFGMAMQADVYPYIGLAKNETYFNLCQKLGRVVNICPIEPWAPGVLNPLVVREEIQH